MRQVVSTHTTGRLARALAERMNELDISIKDLASSSGLTYEHVRKLVKGEAYPSRLALRELCRVLTLDHPQMDQLAIADRLEKKYGGIPHALAGRHPELSLLAEWWDLLTQEQKDSFRIQIRSVAESNEKMASTRRPVARVEPAKRLPAKPQRVQRKLRF
jgi:transcriptional regulator with XRE-family HTH domain